MGLRFGLLLAAAGLPLLLAATAAAQAEELTREEVDRARNHFLAGSAYYEDGRYEDAAREFHEAYRITQHPDVLYNLAQSYDRLDRREEAVEAYRGYLAGAEEAPDRERVERRIGELEELIAAAEQEETRPPVPVEPTPGEPTTPPPEEGPHLLPWILVAAGGALAVGAAITGGMALSIHSDLEDSCTRGVCPPDRQDDIDSGSALATWSTVLTFGALAAAGAGLTLLVLGGSTDEAERPAAATSLEILPGPAPAGAGARIRF